MIKLINLKKKFGENVVLKDLSFTFIEKGLVMILGPSGCGKSTLLNILSGVDSSFDGSVLVDNKNLGNMTERELDQYRLVDVGYVFQNYLLMNLDKVKENIMLPLDISSNSSYKLKEEKANELMKIVGIYDKKDEICNKLSGGEKQRTAIARALVNNPNTLLCDEPTGSLDSKNTTLIMELLKNISKKKLVVVVTHDKEVAKKYGDQIVFMKDGEILNSDISHITKNENKLPLMKVRHKIGKNSLPFIYSIKRAFRHFKEKRWRTLFANFACSLSLLGIGLSSLISSTISAEVKSSFASVLDDSQIVMKIKDEKKELLGVYSGSLVEANEVKNKYQQYIEDVGINYIINFESFFYEDNRFLFMDEQKAYVIPSLNIRHINEFSWLEGKEDLYPSSFQALADDELILGLPYNEVKSLCEELQIKKNYETLGDYISSHNILLVLQVSNSAWKYADEQVFRLKGVAKTSRSKIYHTSHMWNQQIFENQMKFPTSDALNSTHSYPWVMEKIYYFKTIKDKPTLFLNEIMKDETFDEYIFEVTNENYNPQKWKDEDKPKDHILFFLADKNAVSLAKVNQVLKKEKNLSSPVLGTSGGYMVHEGSLLMGFSRSLYFSSSTKSITNIIDANGRLKKEESPLSYTLPSNALLGNILLAGKGVNFIPFNHTLLYGKSTTLLNEIVISSAMAKKLFGKENVIDKELHLAFENNRIDKETFYDYEYQTMSLKIKGVVSSSKYAIYHSYMWPISFFRDELSVSSFSLLVNTVAFSLLDKTLSSSIIDELSSSFPNFSFSNPMKEINDTVDKVCTYAEYGLLLFSFIAIIVSFLLSMMVIYLFTYENKKEIGVFRYIGLSISQTRKSFISFGIAIAISSFLLSALQLVFISIIINLYFNVTFNLVTFLSSLIKPFILMAISGVVISCISAFFATNFINKKEIITLVK